ncbi:Afadin and alpha-actinin-binding-domain-containing protein [Scleroderma yunnanense]
MTDPRKFVHWALDVSLSEFGSPFSEASTSSFASTPSFQYLNSQLIAHGFTTAPGLSLDGISSTDSERVAKCLLSMLSQRMNDMSRSEDLSTKLRTLSYDHERLMNMYRTSKEKVESTEREVSLYKSRLATSTRTLQSSEAGHKQTTADLQRARSSIQGLRTAHAMELKKKEKEHERMVERWIKLVDTQQKVSAASSGISFYGANAEVISESDDVGKSKSYLEVALEHAEASRAELFTDSTRLRRLTVMSANRLQSLIHTIHLMTSIQEDEPPYMDHDTLFPLAPINAAEEKLQSLFSSANDALTSLTKHFEEQLSPNRNLNGDSANISDTVERQRLQTNVERLQAELEEKKLQYESQSTELRMLLGQMREQSSLQGTHVKDSELECERLDRVKKELEDERAKFTGAAVKLSRERAALENERIKFLEEQRIWHEQQLVKPSTTPPLDVTPVPDTLTESSPKKLARKSPRKQKVVGKSSSGRKTHKSRRSSIFSIPPPTRIEPAYETELIPVHVPPSLPSTHPQPQVPRKSILPTSFVLPPPSPRTSLPPPPNTLLGAFRDDPPDSPTESSFQTTKPVPVLTVDEPSPFSLPQNAELAPPQTPPVSKRPFPHAKPLAPHMMHAYSPAKPSPLSRVLILAGSHDSAESLPLQTLGEAEAALANRLAPPQRDTKDDEESPLREKKTSERNIALSNGTQRGSSDKKSLSKTKVNSQASEPAATSKSKSSGSLEKENRGKSTRKVSPGTAPQAKPVNTNKAESSGKAAVTKAPTKLPVGKGGARRVLVGSAEAAPGWKG